MALTERTRPYETLIRHNNDASIGAHHVTITEVLRDGVVINATLAPPVPIEAETLQGILGADLAAALAYIPRLEAQVVDLSQRLDQALQLLHAAHQGIAARDAQIAQQVDELTTLGAELARRAAMAEDVVSQAESAAAPV